MRYVSTRGDAGVPASVAILKGIAKDGGLYVPSSFPTLSAEELASLTEMDYAERAAFILEAFLDDYDKEALAAMCEAAYDRFEDGEAAPIIKVDDSTYMMQLWHGPTLAFKDVALTLLPRLLTAAREKQGEKEKTLILVATSGDTGKAALEGFKDVAGTEIIVIYPSEGVSELQKLQMQTAAGENVHVIGIQGNFDDAQSAVKQFFADEEAAARLKKAGYITSSANSINWGRLAPQIVYYFSAYADLVGAEEIEAGEKVNFVVPTGNFGNILAGYYAKRMGLPVAKLLVASNQNNVLTDFFTTGRYDTNRRFHKTISPSMDILVSSNLERLLYELTDRDPDYVRTLMRDLTQYGSYDIDPEMLETRLAEFVAYWSDEEETKEAIANFFDMFGYLVDPHTAVAVSAYYNYVAETDDETKTVIVETASPYKFAQDVLEALTGKQEEDMFKAVKKLHNYTGEPVPDAIDELKDLDVKHELVVPKEEIKDIVFGMLEK